MSVGGMAATPDGSHNGPPWTECGTWAGCSLLNGEEGGDTWGMELGIGARTGVTGDRSSGVEGETSGEAKGSEMLCVEGGVAGEDLG